MKSWHDSAFFGLHFDLHAGPGDMALGADLTEEHLVGELGKVGLDFVQCDCKGHPGYASYPTKVGTPAPHITRDSLRIWRDATRKLGIPLVVHYSGIWDQAALLAHPEWGRKNAEGIAQEGWLPKVLGKTGLDANFVCPRSPYTTEYMAAQMLEIIDDYDVDGFWVDGENWASAPCYCSRCLTAFTDATGIPDAPVSPEEPGWEEWLSFSGSSFGEHVRRFADIVHRRKPGCTVCSNWMYTAKQPEPVSVPVDYLSGDFDHIWSTRSALMESRFMDGRGMGWDLMAWGFTSYGPMKDWIFKSVPALCQEAAVVLSCGGAFMVYDQPERSGPLVGWHMDDLAQLAAFVRARQAWSQGTQSVPQVAILHSHRHFHQLDRPLFGLGEAISPVMGALQAMLDIGLHADVLQDEQMMARLNHYPLVLIPEQTNISAELMQALDAYVRGGGRLLVAGFTATKPFDEILGVEEVGKGALPFTGEISYLQHGARTIIAPGKMRWIAPCAGEPGEAGVATSILTGCATRQGLQPDNPGFCAATVHHAGKGFAVGMYGDIFSYYEKSHYPAHRDIVENLVLALSPHGLVRLKAPRTVHATLRKNNNEQLVHLVNLATNRPQSPTSAYVEDVPDAGPVQLSLPLLVRPLSVRLEPGARPVKWHYEQGALHCSIGNIGIHDILVVRQGSGSALP